MKNKITNHYCKLTKCYCSDRKCLKCEMVEYISKRDGIDKNVLVQMYKAHKVLI